MANKLTQTAGLTFNVNAIKAKIKDYHTSQKLTLPMFGGGQTAITACLEKLCEIILRECTRRVPKDRSSTRPINKDALMHSVLLESPLASYYSVPLSHYNEEFMYKDQLPIGSNDLDSVIQKIDKDMAIAPQARNVLCYMILFFFTNVVSTCNDLLVFAGRRSLDGKCVKASVKICLRNSVGDELQDEVTRVMKLFTSDDETQADETKSSKSQNEEGEENAEEENAEEENDADEEAEASIDAKKAKPKTVEVTKKVTPNKKQPDVKPIPKKTPIKAKGNQFVDEKDENEDEVDEEAEEEVAGDDRVENKNAKGVAKKSDTPKGKPAVASDKKASVKTSTTKPKVGSTR